MGGRGGPFGAQEHSPRWAGLPPAFLPPSASVFQLIREEGREGRGLQTPLAALCPLPEPCLGTPSAPTRLPPPLRVGMPMISPRGQAKTQANHQHARGYGFQSGRRPLNCGRSHPTASLEPRALSGWTPGGIPGHTAAAIHRLPGLVCRLALQAASREWRAMCPGPRALRHDAIPISFALDQLPFPRPVPTKFYTPRSCLRTLSFQDTLLPFS